MSEEQFNKKQSSVVDIQPKGKPYKITKKDFQVILDNLNEYWHLLLGVPVNFKMIERDVAYMTASDIVLF